MAEKNPDLEDGWILIDEHGNAHDLAAGDEANEMMPRPESSEQTQTKDEAQATEDWIDELLRNKKKKKRRVKKPEDDGTPDAQTGPLITTEEESIWEDPYVPPLQWAQVRNKQTIIANLMEICECIKRSEEHVTKFFFSRLGTSGRFDEEARFVMKGRFQPDKITRTVRKYMTEYVICKSCRSARTTIEQGEGCKETVTCHFCDSSWSTAMKRAGCIRPVGVKLEKRDWRLKETPAAS